MVFTSTTSPLKRRKRFSRCCPGIRHSVSIIRPRHKKEAVLVRIFESHKTTAPAFVNRRQNIRSIRDQLIVKLIDIFNTDKKVNPASSSQHRLKILRKRDSQVAAAHSRHRRFRIVIYRLDLHAEYTLIKSHRLFQTVDFEKQQIQTTNH